MRFFAKTKKLKIYFTLYTPYVCWKKNKALLGNLLWCWVPTHFDEKKASSHFNFFSVQTALALFIDQTERFYWLQISAAKLDGKRCRRRKTQLKQLAYKRSFGRRFSGGQQPPRNSRVNGLHKPLSSQASDYRTNVTTINLKIPLQKSLFSVTILKANKSNFLNK